MSLTCPDCQAENDRVDDICFKCGRSLSAITLGTIVGGKYEILERLGKGGMGTVYKAHDRILDETVALKVLRPDLGEAPDVTRRFRSEIKLARKVTHPNVCRIHEYGEDGALRYISMELVEGIDLKRLIRERGALPPEEAFDVAIQVARGLEAIHKVGIVHRDLKTPNLMRAADGTIRLMDFGIAKHYRADTSTGGTATGQIVGTPEYMSPEQARAERVDARTDLYAFGIVVFELFTGEVPFHADTPMGTLLKHIHDPPPLDDSKGLPQSLKPVLMKALAKNRDGRHSSAREFAEDLAQARERTPPAQPSRYAVVKPPTAPDTMPETTPLPSEGASTVGRAGPVRGVASTKGTTESRWIWIGLSVAVLALAAIVVVRRTGETPLPGEGQLVTRPSQLPPPASEQSAASTPPATIVATPSPMLRPSAVTARPTTKSAVRNDPTPSVAPPSAALPSPSPPPKAEEPRRHVNETPPPETGPTTTLAEVPQAALPAVTSTPPPVTQPGPVQAHGILQVRVEPWADVSVDGTHVGRSPLVIDLRAGDHVVVLEHPDYQPFRRVLTVASGRATTLKIDLRDEGMRKHR